MKVDGTVILAGKNINGMYLIETIDKPPNILLSMSSLSQPTSLEQWHCRLTHCSPSTIRDMLTDNLVDRLTISDTTLNGKCKDYIMGRQTRRPFDGESEKNLLPLNLVSFDLWGPSCTQSAGGKIFLMIIVDAGTSYKYGAYLADKSDATTLASFETFRTFSETSTGNKICRLRSDGTFGTGAWKDLCERHGIHQELTAPYSSAQNRLAELVSASPVAWTEKKTKTGPDATECNRTAGCGCPDFGFFRLPVSQFGKYNKTAGNRSFSIQENANKIHKILPT